MGDYTSVTDWLLDLKIALDICTHEKYLILKFESLHGIKISGIAEHKILLNKEDVA